MKKLLLIVTLFVVGQSDLFGSIDNTKELFKTIQASKCSDQATAACILTLKQMLDSRFDPNQKIEVDDWKMTLTHVAARSGSEKVLDYVVCKGGDPTVCAIPCNNNRSSIGLMASGFIPPDFSKFKLHLTDADIQANPRFVMQKTEQKIEDCGGIQQFLQKHNPSARIKQLEEFAQKHSDGNDQNRHDPKERDY